MEDLFPTDQGGEEVWGDSGTSHSLCALFLSLHQLQLRSSGIRSQGQEITTLYHHVSGYEEGET